MPKIDPPHKKTTHKDDGVAEKIMFWIPLAALPIITNLRFNFFTDSTVTPKWAGFLLTGLLTGLALAAWAGFGTLNNKTRVLGKRISKHVLVIMLSFLVLLCLGIPTSINWAEGVNRFSYWLGTFGFFFAAFLSTIQSNGSYTQWLQKFITLTSAILSSWFWKILLVDFKDPSHDRLVNFSSVGHFNFTADVLVFLIPLLIWIIFSGRGLAIKLISFASLASGIFMLITSGSLGAMGGLVIGGILPIGIHILQQKKRENLESVPSKAKTWLIPLIVILLGSIFFASWDKIPDNYRAGMFQRATWWKAPRTEDAKMGAGDLPPLADVWLQLAPFLGARTPMWAAATGMTLDHPWLGSGSGSFMYEYPAYEKRYRLFFDDETRGHFIRTNPHNVFLQISTENGIPAAILFHIGYLWLIASLIRRAVSEPSSLWLCGLWLSTAALVDAEFNQVFFNPASLFLAALSLGFLAGNLAVKETQADDTREPFKPLGIFISLSILLATLITTYYTALWLASDAYVAQARRLSQKNDSRPSAIYTAWASAYEWSSMNPEALYGLANFYLSRGEAWKAEVAMEEFLQLAPYQPNALNFAASIKADLRKYDEAHALLLKARALEPDAAIIQENIEAIKKNLSQ